MVFSLFDDLDSVNCNQLWQIFYTKRYNFLSNRDRKKERYLVSMKFCCASYAAMKNVKITRKNQLFFRIFLTKSPFFKKNTNLKKKIFFRILMDFPVILTTYLPV